MEVGFLWARVVEGFLFSTCNFLLLPFAYRLCIGCLCPQSTGYQVSATPLALLVHGDQTGPLGRVWPSR